MTGGRSMVLPLVLVVAWALLSVPHGLTGFDLLAGLAAGGAGLLAGVLWPSLHVGGARAVTAADDLLGDEELGGSARGADFRGAETETGGAGGEGAGGDPDRLDLRAVPATMDAVLEHLREAFGAVRLVVWRIDRSADAIAPEHSVGGAPSSMKAGGSPLVWALEERSPLRLQPAPRWADGPVVAAPVDESRVLTVETALGGSESATTVDPATLLRATGILEAFLRLYDQQRDAIAANQRLDRVVDFLHSVPKERDSAVAPAALARAAMEIAGGAGALVAAWDGYAGVVLVREGTGGGPRAGTEFTALDGDLAHAARLRATVRREPGDPKRPALARSDERWERPSPPYRTVIPLVDPLADTAGLLAVWGSVVPAGQGLALLEAIAPLLALQLRQAGDLERYRARASIDPLTGLSNRAALEERMQAESARFHRYRRPVALLVADLDHFKRINDTHGHEAGDAILRGVADAIRGAIRDVDFAARFGGEEMVVLLPETMLSAACDVAERVRSAVEGTSLVFEGTPIPVTASIGLSACPECVDEPAALFASADQALYAAKEAGRNQIVAASDGVVSGGAGG